jgi:Flp pilus assembly protein TadG
MSNDPCSFRVPPMASSAPASASASCGILQRFRRFLRDCRATVAIEFAFALPILCTMTFALYEVTEGIICYMKVVDVANTVSDLIGQVLTAQTGVGNNDFDDYYIAGQMVMYPSTGANLGIAITSVYYDANGLNPTVAWHAERGGAAVITNPTSFVSGLGTAHGSTIIVQATYTYQSAINYFITSPITITSEVVGQPRNYLPVASYNQGIPCPPTNGSESCS